MATRIKDGIIPYTGGIGIEITNNHVINVLLRAMNNLIMVNEDRELYVDLQLDAGIQPDDDFPVGVTTGEILQEDGREQSGTILNWKTTSGDYVRLIYANDDNLYYDPGTGEWRLIATWEMVEEALEDTNTRTFFINSQSDLTEAQAAYDWYMSGKNSIIISENRTWGNEMFILANDYTVGTTHVLNFAGAEEPFSSYSMTTVKAPTVQLQATDGTVHTIAFQYWREYGFLDPSSTYPNPFIPTQDGHPATKKYVDDGLATKQDLLTAGTNITIDQNNVISATGYTAGNNITIDQNNVISANIPAALVYKGNVQTINDLPSSGQTVGDTYFVEGVDGMYSWDGTQWNYVGSTSPSLTNYFNMTINDSDDITEGSIHLFCTTVEKNTWNNKQDALTAGANITIDANNVISAVDTKYTAGANINIDSNNVISTPGYTAGDGINVTNNQISNTLPFEPENAGVLSQVLKKTSTGYRWANETGGFDPENAGTTGQVLKKTGTGYAWADESGGGGGGTSYNAGYGISITGHTISNSKPFEPSGDTATAGQVLTKTNDGYTWSNAASGDSNVKLFVLSNSSDTTTAQAAYDWYLAGKLPVIRLYGSHTYTDISGVQHTITGNWDYYPEPSSADTATRITFYALPSTFDRYDNVTNEGITRQRDFVLILTLSGNTVTGVSESEYTNGNNYFLATDVNYAVPYTPQYQGSPATKGYVDSRNWKGTLTEYNNLPSIDPNIIYNITSLS